MSERGAAYRLPVSFSGTALESFELDVARYGVKSPARAVAEQARADPPAATTRLRPAFFAAYGASSATR